MSRHRGQGSPAGYRGVRSGINLLVARSNLEAARQAARTVRDSGIGNERIVYLPMRGRDTPTPAEVAAVAGGQPFQSMTCLMACGKSPRFCSIGWDKTVAWCSYTKTRAPLRAAGKLALLQINRTARAQSRAARRAPRAMHRWYGRP